MSKHANGNNTATVETLVAEVRVLMMGNARVTLSTYRQLQRVDFSQVEPFGRVHDSRDNHDDRRARFYVIGRDRETGALVRSIVYRERLHTDGCWPGGQPRWLFSEKEGCGDPTDEYLAAQAVPFIVLAGMW